MHYQIFYRNRRKIKEDSRIFFPLLEIDFIDNGKILIVCDENLNKITVINNAVKIVG